MSRAARGNPKAFINSLGLTPFFEGRPGEKEAVGVRLVDLRQAEEGEMNLRQRFVARLPNFAGAANLFDDTSGKRFAIGRRQRRKEARLIAHEGEISRNLYIPKCTRRLYALFGAAAGNFRRTGSACSGTTRTRT